MKQFFNTPLMLMGLCLCLFFSCSKEEKTTQLNVSDFPSTTIYGKASANIDHTNTAEQFAPEGTKILVEIPYSTYKPGASGNYRTYTHVRDSGNYSVQVPVGINTATAVNITFDEFITTVKLTETKSEIQKFIATPISLSCLAGLTYEKKASFAGTFFQAIETYETANFEGAAFSITPSPYDSTKNDTIVITSGTSINVRIDKTNFPAWENDWVGTFTVGAEGKFTASVPSITFEKLASGTEANLTSKPIITVHKGTQYEAMWGCILGSAPHYSKNNLTITSGTTINGLFGGITKKNIKLYFYGSNNLSN